MARRAADIGEVAVGACPTERVEGALLLRERSEDRATRRARRALSPGRAAYKRPRVYWVASTAERRRQVSVASLQADDG